MLNFLNSIKDSFFRSFNIMSTKFQKLEGQDSSVSFLKFNLISKVLFYVFIVLFYEFFFHSLIFYCSGEFVLLFLFFGLFFQVLIPCFINAKYLKELKMGILYSSTFFFFLSLELLAKLDLSILKYNNTVASTSLKTFHFVNDISFLSSESLNVYFTFAVDGISIYFLILTTFLTPLCILVSWNSIKFREKEFIILLLLVEFFVFAVFVVTDLFFFFFFFECVLIPMYFLIGIWGSRQRKLHAVFQFFIYTLFGSVFLFIGILLIYFEAGSTSYDILLFYNFPVDFQLKVWLLFFIAFAIKVPMFPFHIWLPEAHVEAPTAGSVILAGLLLKLGTYGFIRFLIPLFPDACSFFSPFVYTICLMGIIYTSLTTIRQIDLKKIIAYSSVGHMNYVILGLFTTNFEGVVGSIYLMLSHGIVSSALFICVGIIYDRYKTRNIFHLRSLVHYMPIYAIFFLFFTLANVSFPGTSSFVGEFLILIGLAENNMFAALLATFSIIFPMVYSFWLYNRVMYGSSTKVFNKYEVIFTYSDVSVREFFILLCLVVIILFGGFYPNFILDFLTISTGHYIHFSNILYEGI